MSAQPKVSFVRRRVAPVQVARSNRREWMFRAVIILLLVGSMSVAWWSFWRLTPLQKESRTLTSNAARMASAVDDMERKRPKAQDDQIGSKLNEAHAALFTDQATLRAWLGKVEDQASRLALNAHSEFGKPIPQTTNGEIISVIPATISIDVRPLHNAPLPGARENETPYQRVLHLGQSLSIQDKRADLRELTVLGGSNSVTSATMVFHLWAGEKGSP